MAGLLGGGFQQMAGAMQGPLGTVQNYMQQNPYAMLALGMGLLSGNGTSDAFGKGMQGLLAGSQMDMTNKDRATAEKDKAAQTAALNAFFGQKEGAWKPGGMPAMPRKYTPPMQALAAAFPTQAAASAFATEKPAGATSTDDIKEFQFAKQSGYTGTFTDFLNVKRTGAGSTKTSLNPTWGEDDEGNPVLGQTTDQGKLVKTELPPGFKPSKGVEKIDGGTEWLFYDKQTGAIVGRQPKELTQEAADKAAGADQATDLKTANNNSLKATSAKNSIALMRAAASDPNFYSGAFADQFQAAKKLAVALGGDPNLVAASENFESLSNQLVKDRLGTLGTGVSNADVQFLSKTVPTLQMTPQGNKQLLDIVEKLADRDIEIARVAQQYAKDHGGGTRLDQNWSSYLADWAKAHPLFDGAASPAPTPTGAGGGLPQGVVPYTDFFK